MTRHASQADKLTETVERLRREMEEALAISRARGDPSFLVLLTDEEACALVQALTPAGEDEVERAGDAALSAFPADAAKIISEMGDGDYCLIASAVAERAGIPLKRVRDIHRALRTLGFADCGPLYDEDTGVPMGSGYWVTPSGENLRRAALSRPNVNDILAGSGWVYFNDDAGEEYAPDHPVESGEVPGATNIRRSTQMEDALNDHVQRLFQATLSRPNVDEAPVPMILHCPSCGLQHIDEPESGLVWTGGSAPEPSHEEVTWDNPPHRSHLCHGCGCIWRPADVATEGVRSISTTGKADTWKPDDERPNVDEMREAPACTCGDPKHGHGDRCPTLAYPFHADGRPKIAPVQGYTPGIPWEMHLRAYDAYRAKWSSQAALIDLERRGCRGGFGTKELDQFIPGWRDDLSETTKLKARIAELEAALNGSGNHG